MCQRMRGEKLENYFSRLVAEGYSLEESYQGITLADIETVLRAFDEFSTDKRDAVWCLLNNSFPSPFTNAGEHTISDGATTAQIGCYVGILMRHTGKLDREGRDYWLRPLEEIAAVEPVTLSDGAFVPGHIKAKSPNSAYRLSADFICLLQSVGRPNYNEVLTTYVQTTDDRLAAFALREENARNVVGTSPHQRLIEDSINVYARTFLPGFAAVFTDYTDGDRVTEAEQERLNSLGIVFGTIDDLWPDAILFNEAQNTLWFIEAVTSDGEADQHKIDGLMEICRNSGKSYGGTTTTYETWNRFAARQHNANNLAVGSYVWIKESPNKQFRVC